MRTARRFPPLFACGQRAAILSVENGAALEEIFPAWKFFGVTIVRF